MQDFSRRFSIVLNKNNETWQSMNAVGHISAYLGNRITQPFDTGDFFFTKDEVSYPRNSQYPIIVLTANPSQLKNLLQKAREAQLLTIGFIREMIETTNDKEIEALLIEKADNEIELLGVGLFGENEIIKTLTKNYSLWR